ncbi:ornithine carbamoyltransferase [Pikeienuella piscinae]|uniref:Ornithine carbamoyltransferase n=1 Tax=Pikeienuella piscinae TaxID=2748098 RepID=A0A7L5BVY9_9RHOB|nr:ornithine carbamoyltransferase [Pikeienuella piscinae]QIE54044.1 ornithine carbamoyltransferase [Pikeienuella piscinae]
MSGGAAPRHFLDIRDLDAADLRAIIEDAKAMKAARAGLPKGAPDPAPALPGRALAMIFEKPSTRTRVSFDIGMRQLGGSALILSAQEMQLGRGESIADTGRVLSRYVDAIMMRTNAHASLVELAQNSSVPVINGLTDDSHPCQILADVMTFEERRGPIGGKRLTWTGDGNNVATSFIEAATLFGFELVLACPEPLSPSPRALDFAAKAGAKVRVERDAEAAVAGADAVIADTWFSMGDEPAARESRHNQLAPYQVTARLMEGAAKNAIFLHCLPAHRGEEATAEVMDGPQSAIFDEAENRLHVQKAILKWCLAV